MTTEEKAKAYDNIIEKANKMHGENCEACQICIEELIPELAESEDEKIRGAIIDHLKDSNLTEWAAWLEKQGEQKPNIEIKSAEESLGIDSDTYSKIVDECIYGEQKHAEWSEDDEHRFKDAIYFLDTAKKHYASTVELDACIAWLKSLKPQKQWKPSEEQLNALHWCVMNVGSTEHQVLQELLEQLVKLKD